MAKMKSRASNTDTKCCIDRIGYLSLMLGRSFLVYNVDGQKSLGKVLRILRASFFMCLVFYQLIYMFIFLCRKGGKNIERSLVLFNWILQSFTSMCFVIYWQHSGHLKQLVDVVPWKNVLFSGNSAFAKNVCKAFLIFWSIFITCLLMLVVLILFEFLIGSNVHYDSEFLAAYGSSKLNFISYIVTFYAFIVWNTCMTLYVVVSMTVHQELAIFNESLMEIGGEDDDNDCDREKVAEQLLERYVKHVELGRMVRTVDHAFEVYTFIMLGTNIPTTVFTILSFYYSWGSHWYDIVLSIPQLFFCFVQIIGLTLLESIIYANYRIWMPFNDKVYSIADVFISHANQSNLGISIWGFAVVTKPLILTTTSLTITYLTLLIQMNQGTTGSTQNVTMSS